MLAKEGACRKSLVDGACFLLSSESQETRMDVVSPQGHLALSAFPEPMGLWIRKHFHEASISDL